jgi:hypothetical protein
MLRPLSKGHHTHDHPRRAQNMKTRAGGDDMKQTIVRLIGILVTSLLPLIYTPVALAVDFKELSAEWWQWTLSCPAAESPQLDSTGERCAVGERGSLWFLVGNFGGTTTRACSVPGHLDDLGRGDALRVGASTLERPPPEYPAERTAIE